MVRRLSVLSGTLYNGTPADPQPIGQRLTQLAAQLGFAGLAGELVDQRVTGHRQPPGLGLEPGQQRQAIRRRQRIERKLEQPRYRIAERIEAVRDVLTAIRCMFESYRRMATKADTRDPACG
jgi:hypothetical protein